MHHIVYPPSPSLVSEEKLKPSASFKKQVAKVIVAIAWFFVVYLLLVISAVLLAAFCCYLGLQIIIAFPKFITLVAGLGLVGVGVSVIFFLIKFIFSVSKNENPRRVQVTETEQPALYAFIRRLSEETKTPFPRKIYVSPDVNACVFYNSSFWSMFFPVRKNLEIGLGLVNSINISEMKAVIAHEFGHFSQRSMKLGSFTYNVNRIIYNMLYENNSYTAFLNGWGNLHGVLSFFAGITVKIAQGIQYILKQMYGVINKSYMSLSREMEFHADAVAASVAGGNNVVSGLSRIEVAAGCYNTALQNAEELLKEKKIARNIFDHQRIIFKRMGEKYQLPLSKDIPKVSFEFVQSFSTSRINYEDQWASHPGLADRKAHLELLDLNVAPDETSAWVLFQDQAQLQETITRNLYTSIDVAKDGETLDTPVYENWYAHKTEQYRLPEAYHGYYDDRFIESKDWNLETLNSKPQSLTFDELFTPEKSNLFKQLQSNERDMEVLKAIHEKQISITSFDFDGAKYKASESALVVSQLQKEIELQKEEIKLADQQAYLFFYAITPSVKSEYLSFRQTKVQYDEYIKVAGDTIQCIQPLYHGQLQLEEVNGIVNTLRNSHEMVLKRILRETLGSTILTEEKNPELYESVQIFLGKQYAYFMGNSFHNDELNHLHSLIVEMGTFMYNNMFTRYKKLLEIQIALISD